MFIEKIDEQLLENIQEALNEERYQIENVWNGQFIDLGDVDLDYTLNAEIFRDYLHIPIDMLEQLIHQHFPFVKEKPIFIGAYTDVSIFGNNDYKNIELQVHADVDDSDRKNLNEIELEQLDILLSELTQLYEELKFDTSLSIAYVSLEEVPEVYYEDEDDEDDYDFVQIEF